MPATEVEDAFMADLFSGIDASVFDSLPSQSPPKKKQQQQQASTRQPLSQSSLTNSPSRRRDAHDKFSNILKQQESRSQQRIKTPKSPRSQVEIEPVVSQTLQRRGAARVEPVRAVIGESVEQLEERTRLRSFVRAKVLAIRECSFIPVSNIAPPPPGMIRPETVRRVMSRPQVVLELEELGRKDLDALKNEILKAPNHGARRKCFLRDEWMATAERTRVGDIVHLIGAWGEVKDDWVPGASAEREEEDEDDDLWAAVDEPSALIPGMLLSSSSAADETTGAVPADNMLVLNPDVLLSATAISSVSTCSRKPLLQAKLRSSAADDGGSEAILMGRMLHEVLQACLTGVSIAGDAPVLEASLEGFPSTWTVQAPTNFCASFVVAQIKAQVGKSLEELVAAKMDATTAEERLAESAKSFATFAAKYLTEPGSSISEDATAIDARSNTPPRIRIKRVLGVEEDIWSPMYGLKGFVDISVEVEVMDGDAEPSAPLNRTASTPAGAFNRGPAAPKRTLTSSAPPTRTSIMPLELKTGRSFGMLEHRAQTMLYQLMMSDRYGTSCSEGLLYYSRTGELHRVRKVRNEVRGLLIGRNELASYLVRRDKEAEAEEAMLPPTINAERACGRCFAVDGCMLYRRAVDDFVEDPEDPTAIAELYDRKTSHLTDAHAEFFKTWERLLTLEDEDVVRFRRELWTMSAAARQSAGRALADMVIVEDQSSSNIIKGRRYQFVRRKVLGQDVAPFTTHLSITDRVTISVEPTLPALASGSIVELTASQVTVAFDRDLRPAFKHAADEAFGRQPVFRIDKDEFTGGMSRIRQNLARLFLPDGDTARRELVVDLRAPRFKTDAAADLKLPAHLNNDQCQAVRHVLSAEDYALVVGMPGTGKTTTIAELIKLLVAQGKSVLLASYTHSAVDTICRKLIGGDVDLLRLGQESKIHPDVRNCALKSSSTTAELEERLMTPNVVATTCLSVGHTLFAKRRFDYCIVDEASQITLPTCLGPLRFAEVFVLVGDPLQLPPLVRNQRAKEGGLDVSLFSRLAEAHPEAQTYLTRQYRMNRDVMKLSNDLVYDGRLQCGNADVANLSLDLPFLTNALAKMHLADCEIDCWLASVLRPECRVVFLDTDLVPGQESRVNGDLVQNEVEASIISQLVSTMVLAGALPSDIAVITPLRQQIKLLISTIQHERIEILTADRAQGRDKAVVLLSLVRSNNYGEDGRGSVGELLNDARRINVAFTRAQRKLVIVGSRRTLKEAPLLAEMLELMSKEGWIYGLPTGAVALHSLKAGTTQKRPSNSGERSSQPKRHTAGATVVLGGRPFLKDVANELS